VVYTTIQEIVAAVSAGTLKVSDLTELQKCQLDLYAAQGGFRGTGAPSI
jgi:hypothetical protein